MSPTVNSPCRGPLGGWISALPRCRRGAVGVEMALAFPFLVMLLLGTSDLVLFVMTHQRAVAATRTVVDLVTRASSVSATDIADFGRAASLVYGSPTAAALPGVVYSVAFDSQGRASVAWEVPFNGGGVDDAKALATARSAGTGLSDVIVVQTTMTYSPTFLTTLIGSVPVTHSMVARPRKGDAVTLTNS